MFWQRNEDSIPKTFKLTESKRPTDRWMKAVLKADRQVCKLLHPWPAHGESWKLESRNGRSGLPQQELQFTGKGLGGTVSRNRKD
jgi:hypothetical protein